MNDFLMLKKITVLLVLCACFGQAYAWWSGDWRYRKEFVFDLPPGDPAIVNLLSQSVVLVRLHTGNFPYFSETAPTGNDIRFVAGDDLTMLAHEIEHYDPGNGIGLFWVRLPQFQFEEREPEIYMYYGAANVNGKARREDVYSTNDVLVYHFEAAGVDSSRYGHEPMLMTAEIVDYAMIGRGARFFGDSIIRIPPIDPLTLDPQQGMTVSFWARPSIRQDTVLYQYRFKTGGALSLGLEDNLPVLRWDPAEDALRKTNERTSPAIRVNDWTHLALTVNKEQVALYVNGALLAKTSIQVPAGGGAMTVGADADGGQGFTGEIDEVRVAKESAQPTEIRLLAENQKLESRLIRSVEDREQTVSDKQANYIVYSISRLTLEGRLTVIALIMLFVTAMSIMIAKMQMVYKVRKENKLFKCFFDASSFSVARNCRPTDADASALRDQFSSLNHSTLNRVYQRGVNELGKRLNLSAVEERQVVTLSPTSIAAIRTLMEAAMMEEMQRLQKQMVFLTIAISGGPFIGLLGTVVGVMITFAEVALSGTVDVNAIAPGIAAALVATVAGLLVAIPSLFGYNYLSAKIKETVADMRVFVDEFEALIAEKYGHR